MTVRIYSLCALLVAASHAAAQPSQFIRPDEVPISFRSACPDSREFTRAISEALYGDARFGYVETQYSLVLSVRCSEEAEGVARWVLEDHVPERPEPILIESGEVLRDDQTVERAKSLTSEIRTLAQRAYLARRKSMP